MFEIDPHAAPEESVIPGIHGSQPELFGGVLDNKFEEETEGGSPDSPTLDVSEDGPAADEEVDDDDGEDEESDDSSTDDDAYDFEYDEDYLSTSDDSGAETPRVTVNNEVAPAAVSDTPQVAAVPAADQPSQVSMLGGKYILVADPQPLPALNSTTSSVPTAPKNSHKCIHLQTRQEFLCRVIPRTLEGLNLLGAYHRLSDLSNCVNPIHEIVLGPKSFYLIYPEHFGNVHAYVLSKRRLPEAEAANLFRQMVIAVQNCHSKGIILRDLKLGKFVFTNSERTEVKLETLEDAVALPEGGDDGLSDKHGCPNYVSPEKADILRTNTKYPGKATDIWGLGIMLYTMLCGRYPFNDTDHGRLFLKIRRGLFQIPESLSQNVKCVIRCLLRREPESRLTCDQILSHPWLSDQNPQLVTLPGIDLPMSPSLASATKRMLDQADANDQVVPEWVPPMKRFNVDPPLTDF